MNILSALGSLAGKSTKLIAGGLGIFGASQVVPAIQDTVSTAAEKAVEIQSGAQAQNGNIDGFFGGFNRAQGIMGFFAGLALWLGQLTGSEGLVNWANKQMQNSRDTQKVIQEDIRQRSDQAVQSLDGTALGLATGLGGAAAGVGAYTGASALWNRFSPVTTSTAQTASSVLKGAPAAAADDALKVMQNAQVGGLADDAARVASRGGRVGALAGLGVAGLAGYSWMTGSTPFVSEANAAVMSAGALPAAMVPAGAPGAAATALSGETSTSETITVGAGAFAAARALGLKAIPVVGGVITGYETLKDTAGHALNGDWEKAGTELVAGAGLTLGATGGVLSYGLGEAWHAGVRDSSVALMGSDAAIEKAPLRELFEVATGVNTDMVEVAPQTPTVAAFEAAVANSEIVVPQATADAVAQSAIGAAPEAEYDVMGNATGFVPITMGGSFASATTAAPKAHDAISTPQPKRAPSRRQQLVEAGPGVHVN